MCIRDSPSLAPERGAGPFVCTRSGVARSLASGGTRILRVEKELEQGIDYRIDWPKNHMPLRTTENLHNA
eukprot:72379-Pyramimonas_sp.AAC.1